MQRNQIDYWSPRDDAGVEFAFATILHEVAARIERMPGARRIEDRRYVMLDATDVAAQDWLLAQGQAIGPSIAGSDDGGPPTTAAQP